MPSLPRLPRRRPADMDISLLRIRSIFHGNALDWSEDGDIAICAMPNVTVYSPLDFESGKPLEWLRRDLPEPGTFPAIDTASDSSISQNDLYQSYVVSAKWSPTGVSATAGCFLSYLTSKSQLLVFGNSGEIGKTDWSLVIDVASQVKSAITCFDWRQQRWGCAELVVGTEMDGIHVFSAENSILHWKERLDVPKTYRIKCVGDTIYALTAKYLRVIEGTTKEYQLEPGHVSCIHADSDGILVAQPGRVTHFPSGKVTRTGILDSIVGILGTTDSWTVISQSGDVFGVLSFNFKGRNSSITVHGVALHPDRSAVAFCISSRPKDHLYFPSLKNKTLTLSLKSLGQPDLTQTHFSPRALWVSSYLFNHKQPSLPESPPEPIKRLEDLVPAVGSSGLCTYFGVEDYTNMIRTEIANFLFENYSSGDLGPIDRAILTSYGHYNNKTVECPASLEISSHILTETFNFEEQKVNTVIESTCGHKWKRCCITLLPIFSMDTLASTNKEFTVLSPSAAECQGSKIAKALLDLPLCIFNGCRYYVRVFGA